MSAYILPFIFIALLFYGVIKKINVYKCFTLGAKNSLSLVADIFPFICAVFIAVYLFQASGLSAIVSKWLSPIFSFLGVPPELSELMLIRPLSGNGSLAVLQNILDTYGVDSYISRCACVIVGCSETVFYITAVYFSTSTVKKLRYAVPVSLFSCLVGSIMGCLVCRFI